VLGTSSGYFDTIPKDRLLEIVKEKISDHRVLGLIQQFLDQGIMEELRTWTPEAGVPQGAVLSPVLANAYLNPLDHLMAESGFQMVRYADDFVILCRSPEEAEAALTKVREWVESQGLTLHPEKTHIVDMRETSFSFLGYSFPGKKPFPANLCASRAPWRSSLATRCTSQIAPLAEAHSQLSSRCCVADRSNQRGRA